MKVENLIILESFLNLLQATMSKEIPDFEKNKSSVQLTKNHFKEIKIPKKRVIKAESKETPGEATEHNIYSFVWAMWEMV